MAQASVEKLEQTELDEMERVASVLQGEQLARRQSRLCHKEKEQSHQSRSLDRQVEGIQGEREPYLGEKEEIGLEAQRGKGEVHSEKMCMGSREESWEST